MSKKSEAERDEAIAQLREWLKPGDTVHTLVEHVSRSGMSREIRALLIQKPNNGNQEPVIFHPNFAIAKALRVRQGKRDGCIMGGCGMDMGFALVYELSHVLFPDGFGCIGEGCPSNDHSNGDRDYTPHSESKPHHHSSGGYALKQRWI